MEQEVEDGNIITSTAMSEAVNIDEANEAIAEALRGGAKVLKSLFRKNYKSFQKVDKTLVTEADLAAHDFILRLLSERFPDVCVDSEEGRAPKLAVNKSSMHWILDPLDGTENFAALNPYFGIALGLVSRERIVAGGVIQPFTQVYFSFGGAKGPLINGRRFPRSETCASSIRQANVAFVPTAESHRTGFARRAHATLYESCRRLIDNWAPALDWCGLAAGRIDAIVSFGEAGKYQDFDARIGKALFQAVWGRDVCIEHHLVDVHGVPNVLEIASRNQELVSQLHVKLLNVK